MSDALTPMMQQYHRLKQEVPADAILLFRLGDFYEMFFGDAEIGSRLLDLTLTQRQGTPMCGMPYHAADGYIAQLLKAGKRVAICDQMEVPRPGQVVRREVTQVLSPGSVADITQLEPKKNHFLAAISPVRVAGAGQKGEPSHPTVPMNGDGMALESSHKQSVYSCYGLTILDLTTGELVVGEFGTREGLLDGLARYQPAEVVVPSGNRRDLESELASERSALSFLLVDYDAWNFTVETGEFTLREQYKVASLDGLGLFRTADSGSAAIAAAGGLLHYVVHELRRSLSHLQHPRLWQRDDILVLDAATRRNLELVEPLRAPPSGFSSQQTTLLAAVDRTVTSGGGRLLRQWLLSPLQDLRLIQERQSVVSWSKQHQRDRTGLQELLRQIRDVERLVARLAQGSGNARDLLALAKSLDQFPAIKAALESIPVPGLHRLAAEITPVPELTELYQRGLAENPPSQLKEGGLIRPGYHPGLDELLSASVEGQTWLAELQRREQERTGIKSLKVRYNQVFGYYIEISTSNLGAVPADYTRKQTLANAERFITPELKNMEGKILGAQERSRQLEYDLFLDLRGAALPWLKPIQKSARALHELDVLLGWGTLAQERDYTQPEMNDGDVLEIEAGRHPVLEQLPSSEKFVPNDLHIGTPSERLAILTGPNMAGKSTYIRQVALLTLLAHCGSFIPARKARIGRVDRIFTRVGASDDLGRGQSTFMVEMNEAANILNHATQRSLVILDEIGRGTSTFDGLSLAWSIAEYLHSVIKAKTLFATHYHELTDLAELLPGTVNYHVSVREWGEQIMFLRKIQRGPADKSYGIAVARLAGLPAPVLKRANEILLKLEATSVRESPVVKEEPSASDNVTSPTKSPQTSSAPPRISKARQKKENSRQVLQELDLFYDLDK